MDLILEKFILHFSDIYGSKEETFLEDVGRKYFLLFLKPIINGVGNYYIVEMKHIEVDGKMLIRQWYRILKGIAFLLKWCMYRRQLRLSVLHFASTFLVSRRFLFS